MTALRLYLDEDSMDDDLVAALRLRGIDVRTASEHGMLGCSDAAQLRWSSAHGCILYSFNVGDFYALHTDFLQRGERHAGIILAQQQRHTVGDQLRGVLKLRAARSAEEQAGGVCPSVAPPFTLTTANLHLPRPAISVLGRGAEGETMAIVAVFQGPDVTQEVYEQSVNRLTDGKKTRMEAPSDWPVEGLLAHIAGQGPNGFRVVDVWESEEMFQRFGERLLPILQALGVKSQPEIYPAQAFVKA